MSYLSGLANVARIKKDQLIVEGMWSFPDIEPNPKRSWQNRRIILQPNYFPAGTGDLHWKYTYGDEFLIQLEDNDGTDNYSLKPGC